MKYRICLCCALFVAACSPEDRTFGEGPKESETSSSSGGSAPEVYSSCADLPADAPSGVYSVHPSQAAEPLSLYCETQDNGGGWALLFNSVGTVKGETTAFWSIRYKDRLVPKGRASLNENFYFGALYVYGREYLDEVVDMSGKRTEVLHAKVSGFDVNKMRVSEAVRIDDEKGHVSPKNQALLAVFANQLAGGWSSLDHDGDLFQDKDPAKESNCARAFADVTQHYGGCWAYNLGADADKPFEDAGWGPHMHSGHAAALMIATDGSTYSRVKRISRWVRW